MKNISTNTLQRNTPTLAANPAAITVPAQDKGKVRSRNAYAHAATSAFFFVSSSFIVPSDKKRPYSFFFFFTVMSTRPRSRP